MILARKAVLWGEWSPPWTRHSLGITRGARSNIPCRSWWMASKFAWKVWMPLYIFQRCGSSHKISSLSLNHCEGHGKFKEGYKGIHRGALWSQLKWVFPKLTSSILWIWVGTEQQNTCWCWMIVILTIDAVPCKAEDQSRPVSRPHSSCLLMLGVQY